MGLFARIKESIARRHRLPVLGLALGSGGAKGMAHLGALKAFEEAGISFDVITGASIGSIVGALYAKGYTCTDMVNIVESLNIREFARNWRPFSDFEFAEHFLEAYLDCDISALPKPFAAWATDSETNEGVLLNAGKASHILAASAAIPPFFRGVECGGRKLYDGAFTNSIPADVCKDMGADFVVGIDLSAFLRPEEEKGRLTRLIGSAIGALVPVRYLEDCKTRGYAAADVMLRPNLLNHAATDVTQSGMEEMFEIGYNEAASRIDEIKEGIENATKRIRLRK